MAEQKRNTRNSKSTKIQPVNDYGRIQPQAPELEEAVLGALMIEKDAYSLVSEILRPESFYERRHQLIYSAIVDLAVNQKPVDILTVKEQLSKRGDLEEVGGPFYITQLSSKVASSAHIEYHARIIAQKSLARELITFTSNIQSKAFDETLDVDDLMQEAEGKLFEISQQNMKKDYTQINPVIDEAYKLIQKAAARTDGLSGLESGFTKLDKMTSGWQNSDLIIIAARPAMGKTAFVLSMAKNIAVDYRNPVALFSLEMSNVQLVNRLISNVCEIESGKIKSGQLASSVPVGIDIEQYAQRVHKVSDRYVRPDEQVESYQGDITWGLLLYWSAKEAVFKRMENADADLRKLRLTHFIPQGEGTFQVQELATEQQELYSVGYRICPDFVLTWTLN